MLCRAIVLALAICQVWTTRFVIDADGAAYVDVARAWLRGDWIHALNNYWSPLYIWISTSAFASFPSLNSLANPSASRYRFAGLRRRLRSLGVVDL